MLNSGQNSTLLQQYFSNIVSNNLTKHFTKLYEKRNPNSLIT